LPGRELETATKTKLYSIHVYFTTQHIYVNQTLYATLDQTMCIDISVKVVTLCTCSYLLYFWIDENTLNQA